MEARLSALFKSEEEYKILEKYVSNVFHLIKYPLQTKIWYQMFCAPEKHFS